MDEARDRRLRWRCRRGMLELDLWLQGFFDEHFHELDRNAQALFERLLEESDPTLLGWLSGTCAAMDSETRALVERIRDARSAAPE
jgi:antitoxin CptB